MKPATPVDQIHSGTGEGATPGDGRGPASPGSDVRNPQPLPPDPSDQATPAPVLVADEGPTLNGYWQHDDAGPGAYVPGGGDRDDRAITDRIAQALDTQLGTLPDWSAQSIHVRHDDGGLRLVGFVTSDVIRRAAERCASAAAAGPVINDLQLR
jgi:hypothetical protein